MLPVFASRPSTRGVALAGRVLLAAFAAAAVWMSAMPASADGLEPAKRSGVLTPLPAWYGGSSASDWNFWVAGLPPAALSRAIKGFDQEGKPVFVDGQDSVIGAGPGR